MPPRQSINYRESKRGRLYSLVVFSATALALDIRGLLCAVLKRGDTDSTRTSNSVTAVVIAQGTPHMQAVVHLLAKALAVVLENSQRLRASLLQQVVFAQCTVFGVADICEATTNIKRDPSFDRNGNAVLSDIKGLTLGEIPMLCGMGFSPICTKVSESTARRALTAPTRPRRHSNYDTFRACGDYSSFPRNLNLRR
jgi:hypothetical protein